MIHSVTVPVGFLAAVVAALSLLDLSSPPQAATTRAVATKSAIAQAIASLLRMSPPCCYSTKSILNSGVYVNASWGHLLGQPARGGAVEPRTTSSTGSSVPGAGPG